MAASRATRGAAQPTQALPLYAIIEEEHRALHEHDPSFKDPLTEVASLLRFDPDQITDAPDIARKLNEVLLGPRASRPPHPRDPICAYLLRPPHRPKADDSQPDPHAAQARSTASVLKEMLADFLAARCVQRSEEGIRFRQALADRLNDLIYNERPADHDAFRGLELNPYADGLRERRNDFGPRDAQLFELNRLLVEAAFPTQLQRLRDRRLENVYRSIRQHKHAALCLSGGGIRSATFGLGLLQGLAHHRVLGAFDYLSTVSGGGYVGSWLTAWMAHAGPAYVEAKLRDTAGQWSVSKLEPEPTPIRHLRAYSNFLSPRVGLLSADTWTLVATFMRNILLNWLVLVPLMAAATAVPWIVVSVIRSDWPQWLVVVTGVAGLLSGMRAVAFVHDARPEPKVGIGNTTPSESGPLGRSQREFIRRCFFPLVVGGLLLTTAWGLWVRSHSLAQIDGSGLMLRFVVAGVLLHGGAWGFAALLNRRFSKWEFVASVASGGLLGFVTYYVAIGLATFERWGDPIDAFAYATLGLPAFLTVLVGGGQLFLGLVSRRTSDAEREWGARFNAWLLIALVAWLVISTVVLFGPLVVQAYATGLIQQLLLGGIGGGSALTTMLLANSHKTSGKQGQASSDERPEKSTPGALAGFARRAAMALALPLLVASILVVVSALDAALLALSCYVAPSPRCTAANSLLEIASAVRPVGAVTVALVLLAAGWGLGRLIDTNKFSLHAMYRARLIRAFLGASRPAGERHPDRFTGFDDNDNLRMWQIWPAASAVRPLNIDEPSTDTATRRRRWPPRPPLHVVNLALNIVSNPNLAWQERKATSFTVTPLHAGSLFVGYRRTSPRPTPSPGASPASIANEVNESALYGEGISLGTAMTISGAAASPNAGYHSSPLVTFLMTLFNARLGAWLGNPGPDGESTFTFRSPKLTAATIVAELFGFTNDRSKYVYLSDGGHFDNLGLYEMVLRRCRFIVVSDASCDGDCSFEDLGNAIRRIRIDLGVPIEFDEEIPIYPRSANRGNDGRYWAVGRIKYSEVDRPPAGAAKSGETEDAGDGTLIYIKPAFYGLKEPRDVYNYARTSETFPHEATADQFYSESQFESYRALGRFVIDQICANEPAVTPFVPTEPEREADPLPWLEFRARRAPKPPEPAPERPATNGANAPGGESR